MKTLDATVFVTQDELKPSLLAHANVWVQNVKHIILLHVLRSKFSLRVLAVQQVSIDNAFLGPIPERIFIAMVKNTQFVVSASTHPFHFHHYDMTHLVLYANGVQHPSEKITMDCSSPFGATRA